MYALADAFDGIRRLVAPLDDRKRLARIEEVHQIMRHALNKKGAVTLIRPARAFGFPRADADVFVELAGIGVDDLPAKPFGEADAERSLAGRCRPDDTNDTWQVSCHRKFPSAS